MSPSRHGEMWVASLLWTHLCLENGGIARRSLFAIKRTTLNAWKGFSKWQLPYGGLPFAIKWRILIGWTGGHFRGAFCLLSLHSQVGNILEASPRQTLNTNWAKKHHGGVSESNRRGTLNAPIVYDLDGATWRNTVSHGEVLTLKVQVTWTLMSLYICRHMHLTLTLML